MMKRPLPKTNHHKVRTVNNSIRHILAIVLTMVLLGQASSLLAAEATLAQPAFKSGKALLSFADTPLKTMTETPFALEIFGDNGAVISDARLSIGLDMPAMPMPPNHPEATWQNGAYRGNAIFTMAGAWRVTVDIQRPGDNQEQVIFDIKQVMMK